MRPTEPLVPREDPIYPETGYILDALYMDHKMASVDHLITAK